MPETRESIPGPAGRAHLPRQQARLGAAGRSGARRTLRWYRDLLAVRRRHIVPLLPALAHAGEFSIVDDGALMVRWRAATGTELTLMANLVRAQHAGISGRRGQSAVAGRPHRGRAARSRPGACAGACAPDVTALALVMIPRATYRLQLHKGFGFDGRGALRAVPAALGVSHAYLSPYSQGACRAAPRLRHRRSQSAQSRARRRAPHSGSCDRGAEGARARVRSSTSCRITWAWAARTIRCGSMCSNGDRMRRTPAGSISSGTRERRYLHNKMLVPLLGDQYGIELERGMLRAAVRCHRGQLRGLGLRHAQAADLAAALRQHSRRRASSQLEQLADAFAWLPNWRLQMPQRAAEFKAQLAALVSERADVREALQLALRRFEGRAGEQRQLARARRPDSAAALARGPLSRRRRRHQLPPLLQHQRSGGTAHRAAGSIRSRASPRAAAGQGRYASMACASITSTACSIPRRTCAGCSDG